MQNMLSCYFTSQLRTILKTAGIHSKPLFVVKQFFIPCSQCLVISLLSIYVLKPRHFSKSRLTLLRPTCPYNLTLPERCTTSEPHREKIGYCLCENKGADQLRSNCEADQRLCFRYTDSTISLLLKSEI